MKDISLITFILLILISCRQDRKTPEIDAIPKTDWQEMNLKGNVEYIREIPYEVINGRKQAFSYYFLTIDSDEYRNQEFFFNEKGMIIKKSEYDTDNRTIIFYWTPVFDEKGRIKEQDWKGINDLTKITFVYDEKGYKVEENRYNGNYLTTKIIFEYSKKGILEEEKLYDNNNQLRQRVLYEYNSEKQHLIKEKHVSLGGNFLNINNLKFDNITEYTYDSNGNIIEKYGRNDKNNYDLYDYRYDYKYDDKGNWIQCIETQKDGSKIIREREIRYRK